ncbi:MAG: hypothetical protein PHW14_04875 [Candidatus Omnitrophica bacterium]|nr:hypothetical protein [Candidatus Omnitrophota bacterium]
MKYEIVRYGVLMKLIERDLGVVRFFLKNDFAIAIDAFHRASKADNDKAGICSLFRMIFPLIDHVAQLVRGRKGDNGNALTQYIRNNMGEVNELYKRSAGMIVFIYRHGLLHQIQPKRIEHNGSIVEWNIFYREEGSSHLSVKSEGEKKKRLYFDVENFASDFLESIERLEVQLKNDKKLRDNFMNAAKEMSKPLSTAEQKKKDKWLTQQDFEILK